MAELQRAIAQEVAATPGLSGGLLHVHAATHELDVSLAAGVFDRASGRAPDPYHACRVASVTKTFTAVVILRLMEEGGWGWTARQPQLPADYLALHPGRCHEAGAGCSRGGHGGATTFVLLASACRPDAVQARCVPAAVIRKQPAQDGAVFERVHDPPVPCVGIVPVLPEDGALAAYDVQHAQGFRSAK